MPTPTNAHSSAKQPTLHFQFDKLESNSAPSLEQLQATIEGDPVRGEICATLHTLLVEQQKRFDDKQRAHQSYKPSFWGNIAGVLGFGGKYAPQEADYNYVRDENLYRRTVPNYINLNSIIGGNTMSETEAQEAVSRVNAVRRALKQLAHSGIIRDHYAWNGYGHVLNGFTFTQQGYQAFRSCENALAS